MRRIDEFRRLLDEIDDDAERLRKSGEETYRQLANRIQNLVLRLQVLVDDFERGRS